MSPTESDGQTTTENDDMEIDTDHPDELEWDPSADVTMAVQYAPITPKVRMAISNMLIKLFGEGFPMKSVKYAGYVSKIKLMMGIYPNINEKAIISAYVSKGEYITDKDHASYATDTVLGKDDFNLGAAVTSAIITGSYPMLSDSFIDSLNISLNFVHTKYNKSSFNRPLPINVSDYAHGSILINGAFENEHFELATAQISIDLDSMLKDSPSWALISDTLMKLFSDKSISMTPEILSDLFNREKFRTIPIKSVVVALKGLKKSELCPIKLTSGINSAPEISGTLQPVKSHPNDLTEDYKNKLMLRMGDMIVTALSGANPISTDLTTMISSVRSALLSNVTEVIRQSDMSKSSQSLITKTNDMIVIQERLNKIEGELNSLDESDSKNKALLSEQINSVESAKEECGLRISEIREYMQKAEYSKFQTAESISELKIAITNAKSENSPDQCLQGIENTQAEITKLQTQMEITQKGLMTNAIAAESSAISLDNLERIQTDWGEKTSNFAEALLHLQNEISLLKGRPDTEQYLTKSEMNQTISNTMSQFHANQIELQSQIKSLSDTIESAKQDSPKLANAIIDVQNDIITTRNEMKNMSESIANDISPMQMNIPIIQKSIAGLASFTSDIANAVGPLQSNIQSITEQVPAMIESVQTQNESNLLAMSEQVSDLLEQQNRLSITATEWMSKMSAEGEHMAKAIQFMFDSKSVESTSFMIEISSKLTSLENQLSIVSEVSGSHVKLTTFGGIREYLTSIQPQMESYTNALTWINNFELYLIEQIKIVLSRSQTAISISTDIIHAVFETVVLTSIKTAREFGEAMLFSIRAMGNSSPAVKTRAIMDATMEMSTALATTTETPSTEIVTLMDAKEYR